jgi:hypothetical protein
MRLDGQRATTDEHWSASRHILSGYTPPVLRQDIRLDVVDRHKGAAPSRATLSQDPDRCDVADHIRQPSSTQYTHIQEPSIRILRYGPSCTSVHNKTLFQKRRPAEAMPDGQPDSGGR